MSKFEYRDGRFYRDGAPYFLIAAEYMYFRESPANWVDRLTKLKDAGVNCILFYICWRHHLRFEGGRRSYDFTGRTKDSRNVIGFIKAIESLGLTYVIKPGPFIHSELNVGGLPDLVCPKYCPEASAALRSHGRPVVWEYDATPLPAPFDEHFDALAKEWLNAVHDVVAPFAREGSGLIGFQMNDETIYCMSNSPPWHIGYEPSGMRFYHGLLAERYGDIATYNKLHGTQYDGFAFVPAPQLPSTEAAGAVRSREDMLKFVDWAELQWRYRRDLYVRYSQYLGIKRPFLTNYAGITPPIQENVPDLQEGVQEQIPADFLPLYPEWWFAHNRIETDADDYHYGMISWLGVASYDRGVFDRYINTARRARGINMEENWGFGTLYDAKSRYPLIPFYQTLVSVAGGATGYNIFCGVSTDYWDETLDRTTKKQHPTFPSHGPIDEHGNCRPMYYTAKMLSRWFEQNGEDLLRATIDIDAAYLLYAPYAAVSSWVPDERYWKLSGDAIPRCGHDGFEPFSQSLQQAGFSFAMFELEPATDAQMNSSAALAIHTAFYMDEPAQRKLAQFIERGGRLFISGDLPVVDLHWKPCTVLKNAVDKAVKAGNKNVAYRKANFFADGRFADAMTKAGLEPKVRYSDNMRAYVHRGNDDYFIFFFSFDLEGQHDKWIEFYGQRVDLRLGSKTSGVLRVRGGRLVAYVVKGENEVENVKDEIRIQYKDQVIERAGDFSSRED
jgi:beta-galactosidase